MSALFESHLKSGNFYHGYFLAGDFGVSRNMALKATQALLGFRIAKLGTHPDFYHEKFDLFGIEESRELKKRAAMRPFSGSKKVFIIELVSLTAESSNALLKLFEEPPEGTHFFIIIPSAEGIIPTLRSRLAVIENAREEGEEKAKFAEDFLGKSAPERLLAVKKIGKDKQRAAELLDGLEALLGNSVPKPAWELSFQVRIRALGQILRAREFLSDRSANVKMIMEHLALILPKM